MVGLVLVSHSRALANALLDLVRQVTPPGVPIAVAAGVGDDRQEFGTDAVEISEAIQSVLSDDGVCVLMDLGSAVLSAQLAVDLLPPEIGAKVRFCGAPIVEGAIAAAVQAGLGSDLEAVCREAGTALLPKQEQLGEPAGRDQLARAPGLIAPSALPSTQLSIRVTLTNLHGLHARPAAKFVQTAGSFKANIQVTDLTNGKGPVTAKSLNALTTLGAVENHTVQIGADGDDAPQALEALQALVEANFGEAPAVAAPAAARQPAAEVAPDVAVQATPVSEGIAMGPFYRYEPPLPPIPEDTPADPEIEWGRLQQALGAVRQALQQRQRQLRAAIGEADAAIFDAHTLILDDPEILDNVRRAIFERGWNAAFAWNATLNDVAAAYRSLDDPYLQQRAVDVLDVRGQVLFALAGSSAGAAATTIALDEPVILFAPDLTPSETSQLDMSRVLGVMTVGGGPTSHSAILARALGIPAVSGVSVALERLPQGAPVALDGFSGAVWVQPSAERRAELAQRREAWLAARRRLLETSRAQAVTRDGRRVEVFANIGSAQDARAAVENGAEGVGLLRTEFLFLTRQTPPTEDEQLSAYRQIGEAMNGLPVTARTLDIGGDKEAPFVHLPPEANPFLGVRALRLSLHDPTLFLPQLRAILRIAVDFPYRIMFPMVANLDEVRQARAYLQQAHEALDAERLPHAWPIETGIMVEIPSAALLARTLAKEVDFFSIGTNDLTQYTLAAERGNPLLSGLADALHPAVLRLIGEVAAAAHAEGRWVGVCGELAGDPAAAAPLIGLGVDELSLTSAGIPRIKSIVRNLETDAAQALGRDILLVESAAAARRLAQSFLADNNLI
jgi:phosphocarrier protein FPr